jgi:hypothetical protein
MRHNSTPANKSIIIVTHSIWYYEQKQSKGKTSESLLVRAMINKRTYQNESWSHSSLVVTAVHRESHHYQQQHHHDLTPLNAATTRTLKDSANNFLKELTLSRVNTTLWRRSIHPSRIARPIKCCCVFCCDPVLVISIVRMERDIIR